MNNELEHKLVQYFPNLYVDYKGNGKETCMHFGFECGDGWYSIIQDLSSKLERMILEYRKNNPLDSNFPRAFQVKEKFGSLRFYMSYYLDEFDKLINKAEKLSLKTCEICGKDGLLTSVGWCRVRCKEHSDKRELFLQCKLYYETIQKLKEKK